jgi:hypothetical protein
MVKNEEADNIKKCLLMIEAKLAWGSSTSWTNYDFDNLGEVVYEQTKVRLSATTLKRIWGKLKYENTPTLTTLNALAQFAGFEDWRSFKQNEIDYNEINYPENGGIEVSETAASYIRIEKKRHFPFWIVAGSILTIVSCFSLFFIKKPQKLDLKQFEFSANKVITLGVPNSVVFHYDASGATSDSIFIVQTWDIRRKMLVPKNGHDHSAIYYYPGYFRAKLIIDNQIVKTHDLQITSNGWLGLVENGDKPFYFNKTDITKPDRIEINEALLLKNNFHIKPEIPQIRFFNQGDLGNLMNDNFVFETTVKNDYKEGNNVCQKTEVLIQCKDDVILIQLSAKACIGDLKLYYCGIEVNSKIADLSKFGADLTQWTKVRVETVNKQAKIFVNGIEAYSLNFPYQPTGIVGVKYRFNGVGAVKDTWFKNDSLNFKL